MKKEQESKLRNVMPSLRGFIMSAEDKSELDMFKKTIEDAVQGAAIDAMNLLMMKSMEKKEELETDETAIIEETKEEEPEKVESFPKRRGRTPKRMDTSARR